MARRILSVALGLGLTACQVGPIAIVECGTGADCAADQYCELPAHRCVEFEAPPGAAGGSSASVAAVVDWNADGKVVATENALGINGAWWVHDDCSLARAAIAEGTLVCPAGWTTPSCCTEYDPSLQGPAPELRPGFSVTAGTAEVPGRVCLKGTVTRVLNDGTGQPRYDLGYGMTLELPLNDNLTFDATRGFPGGRLIGFELDLEGPFIGSHVRLGIRGEGDEAYFIEVSVPTKSARLLFEDAKQGEWVTPQLPLDVMALQALHLSVATNVDSALPFDFCVSRLRAVQEPIASE